MKPIHYFAGGNTAQGFFSCFENILPTAERKRMFYIKGGPGVGKSTLMRRAGEAAEQAGYAVEYFHCSSDPDSLDGIALPERGLAMMDGTAPHVYDPVIPGARDTLLSLGDFLQETALRPHVREIAHVQGEISARFERCYHYLSAAKCVLEAARRGRENPQKLLQVANGLCEKLPLRGGHGSVRKLFASAYTPKGLVDLLQALGGERTLTVECPFGQHATGLMREISKLSAARGLQVVELLDPLCPDEIAHVVLPAHGLAFCTGSRKKEKDGEWLDAEKLFDRIEMGEKEQSFDRNAYELLLQRAIEQLASAKALHDELEGFYVANMDFIKWNGVLEQVLEAIGE
ncbi:MAG: hypothetical protein RR653_02970 [Clostridia bacterium]